MNPCPADGVDRYAEFTGHGSRYVDDVRSWQASEPADDFAAIAVYALTRVNSPGASARWENVREFTLALARWGCVTAASIAAEVRSGTRTALEVVDEALDAARRLDPVLHFLEELDEVGARAAAERLEPTGPLAGVPFLIKGRTPPNSPIVSRLVAAGAIPDRLVDACAGWCDLADVRVERARLHPQPVGLVAIAGWFDGWWCGGCRGRRRTAGEWW